MATLKKYRNKITGQVVTIPWDKPTPPTPEEVKGLIKLYGNTTLYGNTPPDIMMGGGEEEPGLVDYLKRGARFLSTPVMDLVGGEGEQEKAVTERMKANLPDVPWTEALAQGPVGLGRKLGSYLGRYGTPLDVASAPAIASAAPRMAGAKAGGIAGDLASILMAGAGSTRVGAGLAETPMEGYLYKQGQGVPPGIANLGMGAAEIGLGLAGIRGGPKKIPSETPPIGSFLPEDVPTNAGLDTVEDAIRDRITRLKASQLKVEPEIPQVTESVPDFPMPEEIVPDFPAVTANIPRARTSSSSILPEEFLPEPSFQARSSYTPEGSLYEGLPYNTLTGQMKPVPPAPQYMPPEAMRAGETTQDIARVLEDLPAEENLSPRLVRKAPTEPSFIPDEQLAERGFSLAPEKYEPNFLMKDTVSVYHGGRGGSGESGRWGNVNPDRPASFGEEVGDVSKVELPIDVYKQGMEQARREGSGTYGDVIIPDEYIKQAQPTGIKPTRYELSDVEGLEDLKNIPGLEDIKLGDFYPKERGSLGPGNIVTALKNAGMRNIKQKGDIISWVTEAGERKSVDLKAGRVGMRALGLSPRELGTNPRNTGMNPRSPLPGMLAEPGVENVIKRKGEEGYITLDALMGGEGKAPKPTKPLRKAKLIEKVADITNIPRTTFSSMDISMPLRQGGLLVYRRPQMAVKASKEMIKSLLSDEGFQAHQKALLDRPNAKHYFAMDLPLTYHPEHVGLGNIGQREEFALSTLASKIPGVKHSNRAAVAFLNESRANLADDMIAKYSKLGITPEKDPEFYKAVGKYIGIVTGRGQLGKKGEAISSALQTVLFSPRFIMSRFQALGHALPEGLAKHLPEVLTGGKKFPAPLRSELRKDLAAMAGVYGTVLATATLIPGVTVEVDPRSADWLKIKYKNTRLDLGAGFLQPLRYGAQAITGQIKKAGEKNAETYGGREGKKNPVYTHAAPALRFGRSKLAPYPGLGVSAYEGKTFTGEKVGTGKDIAREIVKMHIPGAPMDITEASKDIGAAAIPMGLAALLGGSLTTYDEEARKDPDKFWKDWRRRLEYINSRGWERESSQVQ